MEGKEGVANRKPLSCCLVHLATRDVNKHQFIEIDKKVASFLTLIQSIMEPEDVSEYSKEAYWSARYAKEPVFDWFNSVYPACLEEIVREINEAAPDFTGAPVSRTEVHVLHLGTGNSNLPFDLHDRFVASPSVRLRQTAMDYSPVVIANMKEKWLQRCERGGGEERGTGILGEADFIDWQVGDIRFLRRDLHPHPSEQKKAPAIATAASDAAPPAVAIADAAAAVASPPRPLRYDVIVDKGTMDALQADKTNDQLDEDIEAMMAEVASLLRPSHAAPQEGEVVLGGGGRFLQVTWETPYFRYHYTKRPEYGWGAVSHKALSDMYYFFTYRKA